MIPPLDPDGPLPPGMHDASLAEVLAKLPAQNLQRQQLNDALKVVAERLWQLDSTLTILVDGSYATVKAEPNDVDLLLISARYNELSVQQYLDQVCPVEAISMHFYVEPKLPSPLLDLFTTTRRGTAKGIIRLIRV